MTTATREAVSRPMTESISPTTMRAFVMRGVDQVGFADKPVPQPGPFDAIVKTTRALVCTSDTHTAHGAIGPRDNLTLGHEAVGIVHQVGAEVKHFSPGDRVVVGAITPDWLDEASQRGYPSQSNEPLGGWKFSNTKDGVFAEYFHVNQADANMALIPNDLSDDAAVYCADMLSTGFMAAELANIPIGGTVAIFAEGPVGLMATAGARLRGAGLVIGVESNAKRQDLARTYGADVIVDFSQVDAVQAILGITGGAGVDSAIEALGSDLTFQNAIRVTKAGGTIANVGYHGTGEFLHIPRVEWGVGMSGKSIVCGLCPGGKVRMERLLQIIRSGRVDPALMTSHTFAFDELATAFNIMDKKLDGVIKPLIVF